MRLRKAAAAGAVLLSAAGCAPHRPADNPATRTVVVRIHHSHFVPAALEFEEGSNIRFLIRNTDPIDHEFILGDSDVQARHEKGTEPEHGEVPGEVSVPAGEERSTSYRFVQPGRLIFACHLPGHYAYGMKGTIRITTRGQS